MNQVIAYKVNTLANLKPNAIVALKTAGANTFSLYVTDLQGVPHSLNLPATTGVQQIINTDGALQVVGSTNVVINLEPALLSVINSALQSGDNISELTNDVGYLTSFTETDPIFLTSEASNFVAGDKANLDNQSGINTNDETTTTIQTKRPLKTVTNKSLEGIGNIGIDYNDLDNKPTIPSPITNHSGLSLDDGTNPHGTTKQDVGLSNVPNLDTTNAVNNEHTHSNKTILDNTTESFITILKNAYDGAVSWITTNGTNLINHLSNNSNPHNVTKSQVGLGNVDNTSDIEKNTATVVLKNKTIDGGTY